MPLPASAIGKSPPPRTQLVDARWLMAYAASVRTATGTEDQAEMVAADAGSHRKYFDSTRGGPAKVRETFDFHARGVQGSGVIAHPIFSWALEWPISWNGMGDTYRPDAAQGELGLTAEEAVKGVHYSEDVVVHRPIVAGEFVTTKARLVRLAPRGKNAVALMRFEHSDATTGELIGETWNASFYRGVPLCLPGGKLASDPKDAVEMIEAGMMPPPVPRKPSPAPTRPAFECRVSISAVEALVYTECSRIWNPIHTDVAAAKAAGLPTIILHGTATLAKAVSVIIDKYGGGDPSTVRRVVAGQFSGMVFMPSTITVRVLAVQGEAGSFNLASLRPGGDGTTGQQIHFEVLNGRGDLALKGGVVVLGPASDVWKPPSKL